MYQGYWYKNIICYCTCLCISFYIVLCLFCIIFVIQLYMSLSCLYYGINSGSDRRLMFQLWRIICRLCRTGLIMGLSQRTIWVEYEPCNCAAFAIKIFIRYINSIVLKRTNNVITLQPFTLHASRATIRVTRGTCYATTHVTRGTCHAGHVSRGHVSRGHVSRYDTCHAGHVMARTDTTLAPK